MSKSDISRQTSCYSQSNAQRVHQLSHGVVTNLRPWREGLVETLPSQACIFCNLGNSTRLGYVPDSMEKYIGIRILESSCEVFRDDFLVIHVVSCVKRRNLHSLLSLRHFSLAMR